MMLTGPIDATEKLLDRTGLSVDDIDLFEINEAFASVVLAWAKEVGAELEVTNPNGGAIAVGHPLGGSGAVLMTRAVHEVERSQGRRALISIVLRRDSVPAPSSNAPDLGRRASRLDRPGPRRTRGDLPRSAQRHSDQSTTGD